MRYQSTTNFLSQLLMWRKCAQSGHYSLYIFSLPPTPSSPPLLFVFAFVFVKFPPTPSPLLFVSTLAKTPLESLGGIEIGFVKSESTCPAAVRAHAYSCHPFSPVFAKSPTP